MIKLVAAAAKYEFARSAVKNLVNGDVNPDSIRSSVKNGLRSGAALARRIGQAAVNSVAEALEGAADRLDRTPDTK